MDATARNVQLYLNCTSSPRRVSRAAASRADLLLYDGARTSRMEGVAMPLVVLVLVVGVAILAVGVGYFNSLVGLRNRGDGAWSDIDVQLKRRHDLIPNLVETVKGYAAHEK